MACKLRLHGSVDEVGEMLMGLKESENIKILSESKVYEDRNSDYIRIYLEAEVKE
ncbi:hypothetical protein [Priestia koreensis]|uniref:hypothetical protein n=1 Tax=Priestia koreensis TaxID=284581 RepID=UPI00203D4237|nr:hypothetical protein [Priestia koreensis]MCM3005688.1 hypothetical protein [Priestia koreensis]